MVYKASGNWWVEFEDRVYGPYGSESHAKRVLQSMIRDRDVTTT